MYFFLCVNFKHLWHKHPFWGHQKSISDNWKVILATSNWPFSKLVLSSKTRKLHSSDHVLPELFKWILCIAEPKTRENAPLCGGGAAAAEKADAGTTVGGALGGNSIFLATWGVTGLLLLICTTAGPPAVGISESMSQMVRLCVLGVDTPTGYVATPTGGVALEGGGSWVEYLVGVAALAV